MIDVTKKYRTRHGDEVQVIAVGVEGIYDGTDSVVFLRDGELDSCEADGRYIKDRDDDLDLIECKPRIKRDVWVNVYPTLTSYPFPSALHAKNARGVGCLACIKLTIDCEEGEGL